MAGIVEHLIIHQDWRSFALVGMICTLGLGSALHLVAVARGQTGPRRRTTVALAALIGGLSIFATHFTGMQGDHWTATMHYNIGLTLISFAAAIASMFAAITVVLAGNSRRRRAGSAAIGFLGLVAMHFTGVAALEVPGHLVFDPGLIVLAVGGGLAAALTSAGLVYGPGWRRFLATVLGATLSILWFHITVMDSISLVTEPGVLPGSNGVSATVMGVMVAGMVLTIITVAGVISGMGWAARSGALAQIREAIEAMPDGLAFFDADDRLVLWNSRYADLNPELGTRLKAGLSFREIIQLGLDEGLYAQAKGREEEWVAERMATRRELSMTMEQHIAGDRWLRVADRRSAAGGIVTVINDITELKLAAQNLAEARDAAEAANMAKSQFLANMSHEIRTPLNGVIGIAQALAETELSPQQQEMLELIHSSGNTLQALLSDILDLARVESGRLALTEEGYDLIRAVTEAGQLYAATAQEKGLQFYVEIAPDVERWVFGDVVRLKQILTNLVSNAVKFTTSGFVTLSVAPGPCRGETRTLRFTVEDTGIGFDSETRERLFSRFEQADGAITRRFGGSGLGLAISHQLATMMDGEMDCESEPGGGSTFILTIPLRVAQAPEITDDEQVPVRENQGTANIRVLLADDHPTNRKVVELILAQAGVELTMAENGVEALEAFRSRKFDLVLMDMQMPVMDGLTATREIRLHEAAMGTPRTPIVMLTANALGEHIEAAEAAGADLHVAKPFNARELLGLVLEYPGSAAADRPADEAGQIDRPPGAMIE
ncbi:ATP-binding protein [uncultured Brevundimonas sp.]|uniref:hybrid sensor histidine kinase/response regulator n=1 Tax=uncultured Brevundimonas sp. TaxID=213418 RepID=UPI0030EB54D7